jgi:hypothetical protein
MYEVPSILDRASTKLLCNFEVMVTVPKIDPLHFQILTGS